MKNSKFNPLFESIYSRFKDGNGFLAGDVVKFKSDYKNLEPFKKLGENIRQRIDDMIKTGNNIRIGRLHNQDSAYGAFGGSSFPACHADLYEEVAPSFWRNLVTVPVELIETNNPAIDLPPVPEGQKDKQRAYQKPVEATSDKPNKGPEINEQTKTGKKQTHADKGEYELATKNTKLANSNKYNDAVPPKVKGLQKAKELNESFEGLYSRMLTEDIGTMGSDANLEQNEKDQIEAEPSLPSPVEMEKMTDEQILESFHNLGKAIGPENFAQAVYEYTKQVSPELLERIKSLSRRNQSSKTDLTQ